MRYKINIVFTDGTMIFLGASSFSSTLELLSHLLSAEVKSFSYRIDGDND